MTISHRRWSSLGMYRFSKTEQLQGKWLFTHGSNPQNKRYEGYQLLIWEDDPSPPNNDEIAEQYLHRVWIDTGLDSDSWILTGRYAAQRAIMFTFRNALKTNSGCSDSGKLMSWMRAFRLNTMEEATRVPVFKLERIKLMTVAMNMVAAARLVNPLRLSSFVDQVRMGNKGFYRRRKRT